MELLNNEDADSTDTYLERKARAQLELLRKKSDTRRELDSDSESRLETPHT